MVPKGMGSEKIGPLSADVSTAGRLVGKGEAGEVVFWGNLEQASEDAKPTSASAQASLLMLKARRERAESSFLYQPSAESWFPRFV